jgi:hypothetical protein
LRAGPYLCVRRCCFRRNSVTQICSPSRHQAWFGVSRACLASTCCLTMYSVLFSVFCVNSSIDILLVSEAVLPACRIDSPMHNESESEAFSSVSELWSLFCRNAAGRALSLASLSTLQIVVLSLEYYPVPTARRLSFRQSIVLRMAPLSFSSGTQRRIKGKGACGGENAQVRLR